MSAQQAGVPVGDPYQRPRVIDERRMGYGGTVVEPAAVASVRTPWNAIQWGPVLGGIFTTMALMLVLVSLGLAIGASAFKPGTDVTDWGTWAGIYGIIIALVAFFCGGWVAAKTSAPGGAFSSVINGFIAGTGALIWLVWMSTTSVANLVGFVGANLANVANAVATGTVTTTAGTAVTAPTVTYGDVETGAWVSFIVLVALLVVAALGGLAGYHDNRVEVVDTTVAA